MDDSEMDTSPQRSVAAASNPAFLETVRIDMLRFAAQQLNNPDEAEDAVQEAMVGALKNMANFRSEAALKTWFIAVLKNKIADVLRQRRRRPVSATDLGGQEGEGVLPIVFDSRGMWRDASRPAQWEDPESSTRTSQFLAMFDACLNRLPPQQGRVFLMREVVELRTDEISSELGLTAQNIHVILHRARLALRACVESNWFGKGARS